MTVSYGENWRLIAAQMMQQQLAEAGIVLDIDLMSAKEYRKVWNKKPFGFTPWRHRPLGTMALQLAYRSDAPWNESHYDSPEFDEALALASQTLEVQERRTVMRKVESILQNDAVIAQPVWLSVASATNRRVQGFRIHPELIHDFHNVWLDS